MCVATAVELSSNGRATTEKAWIMGNDKAQRFEFYDDVPLAFFSVLHFEISMTDSAGNPSVPPKFAQNFGNIFFHEQCGE